MYGDDEERAIAYHYAKHVQDILLQICMVNYSKYMLELYATGQGRPTRRM